MWKRDFFGWEYKGKHRDLNEAYRQLLLYREALENPPLLVVCDMDRFEVRTNFTRKATRLYAFDLASLAEPANLDILHKVFFDPDALSPDVTREKITEEAADRFGELADGGDKTGTVPLPQSDAAVFAAYGWAPDISDEEILERLLALNLQRAGAV